MGEQAAVKSLLQEGRKIVAIIAVVDVIDWAQFGELRLVHQTLA